MSAAQSAHYIADKDGRMHPTDVWSLVESSKPTRIDRWEIPTRWRVQYRPCFGFEGMTDWAVYAPGGLIPRERFRTWRDAMDYADRMARTREYVLPRPDKDGDIATTDEQVAWEGTEIESNVVSVAWIEEPGTIGLSTGDSDHYMTTDGARSIALALLALAEEEGSNESA